MTSYFEQLFKQMFIQRYSHINNVEGNIKGRPIKIASEYKKILDAMLRLTRSERIILAFNIIAEMRMAEIAFLLDTTVDSTYAHKSSALKKLKAELENIS